MNVRRSYLAAALVAAALPSLAAARHEAAPTLHLALEKSAPAADEVVTSPPEIRLWFTQAPQRGVTTIRAADPTGGAVALGDVQEDRADPKVISAPVRGVLAPGRYTVEWRTMAADGHVVGGEFAFAVRAP